MTLFIRECYVRVYVGQYYLIIGYFWCQSNGRRLTDVRVCRWFTLWKETYCYINLPKNFFVKKVRTPATRHGGDWGRKGIAPTHSRPRH
jgi:hypothetical protein